ncbi:GntR family transcriptional regulator [Kribbella sp. NPDC023972]|uniref:GntR family transcriptional regulator n=1 Tax=Kribbella sp. NPDC023972 TaxID=3154795 RepID=UPI0033FCDD7F
MRVEVAEDSPEPPALVIARRWVDPAGAEPIRATIRQLAEAMGIDTSVVREGLRELVADGIVVVQRRACCAPQSDLCDPAILLDNEHFELTPGWAYRREIRTPRAVPSIAPTG